MPDKDDDGDVLYVEAQVPFYALPAPLVASDGKVIQTAEEWFHHRRPEIIGQFANLLYGAVPFPSSPIITTHEVIRIDASVFDGQATRKDVRIRFENASGTAEMQIVVFSPNGRSVPGPAFLHLSFTNTRDDGYDISPDREGYLRCGVPLAEILSRGYGYVAVYQGNLVRHNEVDFNHGIHPLFYAPGQSFPHAYEWGVIGVVAWSASRALDYLETDTDIDATRIAMWGHSKMGKTALWAAALDERFALVIAAQSGCAGAALWRRRFGETLEKMVTRFPYWLCRNAWRFVNNEMDLPIDQHMLLACIAPRPLYVCSGEEDLWADPRGEYLGAYHASEVYRLLGKRGLDVVEMPPLGQAMIASDIGYHIRAGGHAVEWFDWQCFLNFAEYHLGR